MKIFVILILYFVIENSILLNRYLASRKWGSWIKSGIVRQPALFGYCYQDPVLANMLQLYNFRPEILEVKCPFSAKDMTIPEAIENLNHFCLGWLQL